MSGIAAPTFANHLAATGMLEKTSLATRRLIAEVTKQATEFGQQRLQVLPSCYACGVAKGCCKLTVRVMFYEAVPIVTRLRRDGRDTPALRQQLAEAADAMEITPRSRYFRPCVFLGPGERCSIYEDRPSACGSAFVFSNPNLCNSDDPSSRVQKFATPLSERIPRGLEQAFLDAVGLERTDFLYLGALPRMVLLCLEIWDEPDFVRVLAERVRTAAFRFSDAVVA